MLTNALIRIEGPTKALPAPFELLGPRQDVWVLEFPVSRGSEGAQLDRLRSALEKKKLFILRYTKGDSAFLHLAFSSRKRGPRSLKPALIRTIAELSLTLEVYEGS